MLKKTSKFLIGIYQKTISPDHGPLKGLYPQGFCRYYPSCSEYTKEAICEHGFVKGGAMGAWRICRCNPWTAGGYDPVPKKEESKKEKNK